MYSPFRYNSDIISEPLSIKARRITDLPAGDQTETLAVANRTILLVVKVEETLDVFISESLLERLFSCKELVIEEIRKNYNRIRIRSDLIYHGIFISYRILNSRKTTM